MNMNKELPTITATRVTEWQLYWLDRIAQYWSLGCITVRNWND